MANETNAAIGTLNQPFKNRDCRRVLLGGPPQDPGIDPYPQNPHWNHYLNRVLFPQLLSPEEMLVFFSVDHQTFYGLRDEFVIPYIQGGGPQGGVMKPHRMTPDALMGLLLFKCHENPSDRLIGALFGESASAANKWLHGLRVYIYQNDNWLVRGRNLSIDG